MNAHVDDADGAVYREIERVLDGSAAAWSAGDLDAFMACYEDSPDTLYLTATQIVTGYTAIRAMYAARFSTKDGTSMGTLKVKLMRVTPFGPEHVLAVGLYSLAGAQITEGRHEGLCSLLLHDTSSGWRICADHTS